MYLHYTLVCVKILYPALPEQPVLFTMIPNKYKWLESNKNIIKTTALALN